MRGRKGGRGSMRSRRDCGTCRVVVWWSFCCVLMFDIIVHWLIMTCTAYYCIYKESFHSLLPYITFTLHTSQHPISTNNRRSPSRKMSTWRCHPLRSAMWPLCLWSNVCFELCIGKENIVWGRWWDEECGERELRTLWLVASVLLLWERVLFLNESDFVASLLYCFG